MNAFEQGGAGVFIAPTTISSEVEKHYGVKVIEQTERVRKHFYAISVERKNLLPGGYCGQQNGARAVGAGWYSGATLKRNRGGL